MTARILAPGFGTGLASLGFRGGPSRFRRGDLAALLERDWCTFRMRSTRAVAPPAAGAVFADDLGHPGLWQRLPRATPGAGARAGQQFHLPLAALAGGDEDDLDRVETLAAVVRWVETTARGALPAGWTPPSAAAVDSWDWTAGLTVQSGPFAVQGELVRKPERLALRFPLLPPVSAGLSDSRRAWLEEVIGAARRRWRLVRVGWEEGAASGPALAAEVDLSGAPLETCEPLARIGAAALRWVVSWLIVPVRFLSDPGLECEALDVPPERAWPAERSFTRARNRWSGDPAAGGS